MTANEQTKRWPFDDGLLLTSSGRGWSGLEAELWRFRAGDTPPLVNQTAIITLFVSGNHDSTMTRRSDNRFVSSIRAETGLLCLCPAGFSLDSIHLSAALPEVLRIRLSNCQFATLADTYGGPPVSPEMVHQLDSFTDPLIRQLCLALLTELRQETTTGRMLAESICLTLTARLVQAYTESCPKMPAPSTRAGLDKTRLRRVLDYIRHHLDNEIHITDLAAVACLSPFHFARMFKEAVGKPPHSYVSHLRLERAKELVASGELPLNAVAELCGFSSHSSFNRAFSRVMSVTPGEYRRMMR